jgi:enamine deaminase RidA (YjgF/YER057c/UK114 family)
MLGVINTPHAPSSPFYSQAAKAGQHVYGSGPVGVDVSTGDLARVSELLKLINGRGGAGRSPDATTVSRRLGSW